MKNKKKIVTEKAPKAIGPYSQAISDGYYLFVSGQLPVNPETGKLVDGGIEASTHQVFDNLQQILAAGGCTLDDVVRMEVFMQDLGEFALMNKVYTERFGIMITPARYTIQAAKLPMDAPLEIACIAKVSN